MQLGNTLVTTVGFGVGVALEPDFGVFEQLEVVRLAVGEVSTDDFPRLLVDDYLA